MSIKISDQFEAGAIEVLRADSPQDIALNLRKDTNADFMQWFYFQLEGACGEQCAMRFLNAGQATYPAGWEDYRAVASYDRANWFRVPTSYDGQVMTVLHTPECDSVYYACFEPYALERHQRLLDRANASSNAHVQTLGATIEGRDLNLVVVGNPLGTRKVWVIARQHPGESMSEWFVEGMVDALIDTDNVVAQKLLAQTAFYIVPNMNPDGVALGNLRTNAAGANLNREWMAPSMESSPEVFMVRNKIHEIGCDFFLDIHGDEILPYVFVAGCELLEGFSLQQAAEQDFFVEAFKSASRDFQDKVGYTAERYQEDILKLASKYIGHTFQCVSLTLEMPFKDNANFPDPAVGWDGARSARLGQAILQPILQTLEREFR